MNNNHEPSQLLIWEIKDLIEQSRSEIAVTVNSALTLLYWQVGQRINKEVLGNDRAEYGKHILQTLSAKLTAEYGRGWSERNLAYMIRFVEAFPSLISNQQTREQTRGQAGCA